MADCVLSIDQSTQGTKALLFDETGKLLCRTDMPHCQIVNDKGWVEHDPEEKSSGQITPMHPEHRCSISENLSGKRRYVVCLVFP